MNTYVLLTSIRQIKNQWLILPLTIIFLCSCNSETLFQSNFNSTANGQPPAHNQQVGTANVDGPSGSVKIIASPTGSGDKWVQITRSADQQSVSGLQCVFSKFIGDGEYTFSANLFIPSGSGLATIQFESFTQSSSTLTNFLHIDFTQDNRLRIDDNDATKFESFPRNQIFQVQVTLKINANSSAHIVLGGAGASGQIDYVILPAFRSFARQFGGKALDGISLDRIV